MQRTRRVLRFHLILWPALALIGGLAFEFGFLDARPDLRILHLPETYSQRAGDFTATICGETEPNVRSLRFRLNGGDWQPVSRNPPRIPPPLFNIELSHAELRPGANRVEIDAATWLGRSISRQLEFEYRPGPISLPLVNDWRSDQFDVQDGCWERIEADGEWRVRPRPGYEDYDRVIVVAGAFPEGRRVSTHVVFRDILQQGMPYGFGILPLWGGRPDVDNAIPRRGWNFSLAWYYSHYKGVGNEFSFKGGGEPPQWVSSYRNIGELTRGGKYFIVVESWPETGADGSHLRYRQRMKWWADGDPEPIEWLRLSDTEGCPIPAGAFSVALVAHRCQVEFGPVTVEPIPGPVSVP